MKNQKEFERTLRRAAVLGLLTDKITIQDWEAIQSIFTTPIRKTNIGKEFNILTEVAEDILQLLKADGHITIEIPVNTPLTEVDCINWDDLINPINTMFKTIMFFIKSLLAIGV